MTPYTFIIIITLSICLTDATSCKDGEFYNPDEFECQECVAICPHKAQCNTAREQGYCKGEPDSKFVMKEVGIVVLGVVFVILTVILIFGFKYREELKYCYKKCNPKKSQQAQNDKECNNRGDVYQCLTESRV